MKIITSKSSLPIKYFQKVREGEFKNHIFLIEKGKDRLIFLIFFFLLYYIKRVVQSIKTTRKMTHDKVFFF